MCIDNMDALTRFKAMIDGVINPISLSGLRAGDRLLFSDGTDAVVVYAGASSGGDCILYYITKDGDRCDIFTWGGRADREDIPDIVGIKRIPLAYKPFYEDE